MSILKITYDDKQQLNANGSIAAINKCQASDLNEIKTVVNTNADNLGDLSTLTTSIKTSVVDSINSLRTQKILHSGGYHMTASQTASLSENISSQTNGVVLVWVPYVNGEAQAWGYNMIFVPKYFVNVTGRGMNVILTTSNFGNMGVKYIYIDDNQIRGHASNTQSGTASGITYDNQYWVLRYVIGV